MATKPKVFGHLLVDVIRPGRCVACGSCISICPEDAISFVEGAPKLTGKCKACGECYIVCPRTEHDLSKVEEETLGRSRNESEIAHGVVKGAYAVRTLSPDVKAHAQDGGAVTSILLKQLDEGVEGAIVAGLDPDKVWSPVPVVAKTRERAIECAGTKYTSAPMLMALEQAVKEGLGKVAFVSTPCQIQALKIRESLAKNEIDALAVGLFCMETFDYDRLMAYLREQGVDPATVKKFEIKSGKFTAHMEGKPSFEVKIRKLKDLARPCCRICQDYTSELADLSVGNVGSPEGWSSVLVRTDKGEAALRAAEKAGLVEVRPLTDFEPGMSLIDRLSDMKKRENSGKPPSDQ